MTDKEVTRFKVKFPKVNLSKTRLDGIKLLLADDADDAAIDARLDEVNGNFSFEDMARHDDRQRQPAKPDPAPQPKTADPAPANEPDDKDTPSWAKGLLGKIETLTNEVTTLKAGKVGDTRRQQLEKAMENVNENYRNGKLKDFARMQFKDDEEFNTYLEEVKTDSAEFVQTETNAGLSKAGKPIVGTGGVQGKTATDKELDDAMSNISI